MADRKQADHLIAEFGASIGMEGLRLDDHGVATFIVDDTMTMHIGHAPDGNELILFADLGSPADDDHAVVDRRLLEANFMWQETEGATLAVECATGHVVLMNNVAAGLHLPDFAAAFEQFLNLAERWRQRLADPSEPAEDAEAQPGLRV